MSKNKNILLIFLCRNLKKKKNSFHWLIAYLMYEKKVR